MEVLTQYGVEELQESLYLMHSLKIVHFDIKPDNIMYSPTFKRTVFIDFGLSEAVPISAGQRMLTLFRGTLNLCSVEMIETFYSNEKKMVDIYDNDIVCFNTTISCMTRNLKSNELIKLYDQN